MRVVFDFGAVLFRWRPAVVLAQTLKPRSVAEQQAALAAVFQGYGGDWGDFDLGLIDAERLSDRIAERAGLDRSMLRALIDAAPDELRPQPAVLSLLLQLRARRTPLSFLSNMPLPYAALLEQRYPLQQWFESGLFSGRVHQRKPDPTLFEMAARHFASAPGECLLIDDHPANV